MKINRGYKPKPFKFKDNYNIDYTPYYIIENGVYSFQDKLVRNIFMYRFGIMCKAQRKIINNSLKIFYNGQQMTQQQFEFIQKRAIALSTGINNLGVSFNCGCNKKKTRPE